MRTASNSVVKVQNQRASFQAISTGWFGACPEREGLMAVNDDRKHDSNMLLLLGELKGMVAAIKQDVDDVKEVVSSDKTESSASRRRLYDKLDGVDRRLTKLESTVTVIGGVVEKQTRRMDAIEPVVRSTASSVRQWALRWGVVTAALGTIASGAYWLFTSSWQQIWSTIIRMFPPSS